MWSGLRKTKTKEMKKYTMLAKKGMAQIMNASKQVS